MSVMYDIVGYINTSTSALAVKVVIKTFACVIRITLACTAMKHIGFGGCYLPVKGLVDKI